MSLKEAKRIKKDSGEVLKNDQLVISETNLISADRSPKDIANWVDAQKAAISIVYPNRTRILDLYEYCLSGDGHLFGIIDKRIKSVKNKKIIFKKGQVKVDAMDDVIQSLVFDDIMYKILETKAWGFSGMEFVPGDSLSFEEVPRKHIKPEFGVITINQSDYTGFDYTVNPNIIVTGKKKDLGFLLICCFYSLIKKGDISDWAQFVEIFGQPVKVIKYDAYDKKTKEELRAVLDEAGNGLTLMIPKQANFEMIDGKGRQGDGKLQDSLKNACNEEMSKAVLGNTETTESSASSGYAQSQTHATQQDEIIQDDMKYLINNLNDPKFLSILKSYGYPVEGGRFEFEQLFDLDKLGKKKDIDIAISQKVPIADDYWYETYGIPKPDNYNELRAKMDAEKLAKASSEDKIAGENKAPKKKGLKKEDLAALELSLYDKIKLKLSDFFDPAHR
jgi:phage gp29-like protein